MADKPEYRMTYDELRWLQDVLISLFPDAAEPSGSLPYDEDNGVWIDRPVTLTNLDGMSVTFTDKYVEFR